MGRGISQTLGLGEPVCRRSRPGARDENSRNVQRHLSFADNRRLRANRSSPHARKQTLFHRSEPESHSRRRRRLRPRSRQSRPAISPTHRTDCSAGDEYRSRLTEALRRSIRWKNCRAQGLIFRLSWDMSVQVYGCNHVAIEVDDVEKAVAFYKDVFNLEQMRGGEGDAFFKLGEHQFLAIFEVDKVQRANMRHFGIMVRDEAQLEEVRKKLTEKYKLKLEPPFRCDFRDPWGNRIQVVDLHDESLVWLLPYREVQKAGVRFGTQ